jgi:hypothetical protein
MFATMPHSPRFREAIFSALATETDSGNQYQLCQLEKEMALAGDAEARQS